MLFKIKAIQYYRETKTVLVNDIFGLSNDNFYKVATKIAGRSKINVVRGI